jgi:hypothetical protein
MHVAPRASYGAVMFFELGTERSEAAWESFVSRRASATQVNSS